MYESRDCGYAIWVYVDHREIGFVRSVYREGLMGVSGWLGFISISALIGLDSLTIGLLSIGFGLG